MEYTRLGRTGLSVSRTSFGALPIQRIPESESTAILRVAYEAGINFYDTANAYTDSEFKLGQALGDVRRNIIIATKTAPAAPEVMQQHLEQSLKMLRTDYIDIYFAHAEDAGTPVEETLRAFDKLIRDGKVRCIGASNHQAWRLAEAELMARAAGLPHYVVLQQRFSYLQPVVGADFGTQLPLTPEQTDFCARHGVLLMAYSPLLGGLYEKPEIPVPVQYRSEHSDKLLELLRRRAAEWGYTPSQLVLGWMLALSPCVVPEVTASRLEHLEANLREVDPAHAAVFAEEVASVDSFTVKYS